MTEDKNVIGKDETKPELKYERSVLKLAWYLRYFPLMFLLPGALIIGIKILTADAADGGAATGQQGSSLLLIIDYLMTRMFMLSNFAIMKLLPTVISSTLGLFFGFILPAFLFWRILKNQPAEKIVSRKHPVALFGAILLIGLIVLDLAIVAWWYWEPPCKEQNVGWLLMKNNILPIYWIANILMYLYLWVARVLLVRKKKLPQPPPIRISLLDRVARLMLVQFFIFSIMSILSSYTPLHNEVNYEHIAFNVGMDAARAEDVYASRHQRYTDDLKELIHIDPDLGKNDDVTFHFEYAGQTHFTFSTMHKKGCEPSILNK